MADNKKDKKVLKTSEAAIPFSNDQGAEIKQKNDDILKKLKQDFPKKKE
jgi:hypothetical protein